MGYDEIYEYLRWQREVRRRKPETLYAYEGVLQKWLEWLGDVPLNEATAQDVEAFSNRPRTLRKGRVGGQGSPATVARDVTIVSSLYDYLAARYGIRNPAALAGRPTVHNRSPRPISDEQWLALWRLPDLDVFERGALGLMFLCGFRRSEVVRLAPIHYRDGQLVGFVRKGGGEDTFNLREMVEHWDWKRPQYGASRFLSAFEEAVELRDGEDTLVPWPKHYVAGVVDPHAVTTRMRAWLKQAGLQQDAFTPHCLRHSFVTNLLETGVPIEVVSDLANHSGVNVTMRYAKTAGRLGQMRRQHSRYDS